MNLVSLLALLVTVIALPSRVGVSLDDQSGDACAAVVDMATVPAQPTAGTIFELRLLLPDTTTRIVAMAGPEPLHFERRRDTLVALAPMPIDSTSGITVELTCSFVGSDMASARSVRIAASPGEYRMERLTVAPRFSAPPDSAVAARMRRESARAAEVSRASHRTPRLWTEAFIAPRDSRITSGFGHGRTFNGEVTSRHTGLDYAGAVGAPVRAVNRGVVRIVDRFYLGGSVVYVDHGAGIVTAYLHLSKQSVAEGDTVQRGQVLGAVGATGRVTGPHLHLITRFGNVSVDPRSLIGKR